MFLLISRNSAVDMAVKNRVVDGSKPVRIGTRNVAPNMAMTCCAPISAVRGQVSLSSGSTTSPGFSVLPSPWSFHVNRPAIGLDMRLSPNSLTARNTNTCRTITGHCSDYADTYGFKVR